MVARGVIWQLSPGGEFYSEELMITGSLSPEGAAILRQVRDVIQQTPEEFDLGTWECGSTACIAGHCNRAIVLSMEPAIDLEDLARSWAKGGYRRVVSNLGFTINDEGYSLSHEDLDALFSPWFDEDLGQVETAVTRINAFLWKYGYPPDEVQGNVETRQAQAEVQA